MGPVDDADVWSALDSVGQCSELLANRVCTFFDLNPSSHGRLSIRRLLHRHPNKICKQNKKHSNCMLRLIRLQRRVSRTIHTSCPLQLVLLLLFPLPRRIPLLLAQLLWEIGVGTNEHGPGVGEIPDEQGKAHWSRFEDVKVIFMEAQRAVEVAALELDEAVDDADLREV